MSGAHAVAVAVSLLLWASPAASATTQDMLGWDARARTLIDEGRFDEANAVLDRRLARDPRDVQARFLKGLAAIGEGKYGQAIRTLRSILIEQPKATRVRLELARAFFLAEDYENATRQFQFALAADPPPGVAATIRSYLATIREAKSFSYNFTGSLAPDTNLNGGSSAREVTLFGIPFDLSEEARQRSGVGLALEGGAEWLPAIGEGKRLRLGVHAQRREYAGSKFDDMTVAVYAGPRIVTGNWDVSVLGTAYKRWYGSNPYNRAVGGRVDATLHATPRLDISAAVASQFTRHRVETYRDGLIASASTAAFYTLTPISAVTFRTGIIREKARNDAFSNWSSFIAAGYFRELPMGFSIYLEPSFSRAHYDEALLAFGRKRKDNTQSLLITVLNRHIVLGRFTPRVSYTHTNQDSSIGLYEFKRNRLEVGLTTAF
jgi:tetratricopeptide (TPR) repeat protein